MSKSNFVLTVAFHDGTTAEMFNLCGLHTTTLKEAKRDAVKMVKKAIYSKSLYGKMQASYWKGAKPYSMRWDNVDTNGHYSGRGIYTF